MPSLRSHFKQFTLFFFFLKNKCHKVNSKAKNTLNRLYRRYHKLELSSPSTYVPLFFQNIFMCEYYLCLFCHDQLPF